MCLEFQRRWKFKDSPHCKSLTHIKQYKKSNLTLTNVNWWKTVSTVCKSYSLSVGCEEVFYLVCLVYQTSSLPHIILIAGERVEITAPFFRRVVKKISFTLHSYFWHLAHTQHFMTETNAHPWIFKFEALGIWGFNHFQHLSRSSWIKPSWFSWNMFKPQSYVCVSLNSWDIHTTVFFSQAKFFCQIHYTF